MPTAAERARQIEIKLRRADRHIGELQQVVSEWLATEPFKVDCRPHPSGMGVEYFVSKAEATPEFLSAIVGDGIQCLVTALDHLAWQIVCSDTDDNPPSPSRIYFPVCSSLADYQSVKGKKLPGAASASIAAIDNVKPYRGGNDRMWELYELNRREKHRMLLTVGSTTQGINLSDFMWKQTVNVPNMPSALAKKMPASSPFNLVIKGDDDGKIPVEVGMTLFGDQSSDTPNTDFKFHFGVGLSEPQVIQHINVVEALTDYKKAVEGAFAALSHLLRTTP